MPHVDRGAGPLFHLIMLLQMSRFAPGEICFIGDEAYFTEEHIPFGEELALGTMRFTCVSQERYRAYARASLPFSSVAALYADGRNHLDAFKELLTAEHAPLVAALSGALGQLGVSGEAIEAFLTWSNCPSLSALAARIGKPVIHNELGPFRGRTYQDTVYFDFRGVNGNTTPAAWTDRAALAAALEGAECLSREDLRALLYCGEPPAQPDPAAVRYALGVALQVEDDSNTVAHGRGYDTIRLLYQAQRNFAPARVLVRSHPGAHLAYRGGLGDQDTSPSSVDFLQRVEHLVTINSSVAAEAALWGLPFTTFGDTPFGGLSSPLPPAPAPQAASGPDPLLNALLLAYLVPGSLLYDPEYYRWRLAGATLRDCLARHLQVLRRNAVHAQGALTDLAPAPAVQTEARADPGMPQRNPALWSATRSLSRSAEALEKQLAALETRYAAAITERDEIWDARCWFQSQCERMETEMQSMKVERDTLRVALAKQSELDLLKQELALRDARYAEMAASLAEMRQRVDAVEAHHAIAEAQNNALLEELNRTQRERIEARERAAGPFSR
jgi:hypothetical protein